MRRLRLGARHLQHHVGRARLGPGIDPRQPLSRPRHGERAIRLAQPRPALPGDLQHLLEPHVPLGPDGRRHAPRMIIAPPGADAPHRIGRQQESRTHLLRRHHVAIARRAQRQRARLERAADRLFLRQPQRLVATHPSRSQQQRRCAHASAAHRASYPRASAPPSKLNRPSSSARAAATASCDPASASTSPAASRSVRLGKHHVALGPADRQHRRATARAQVQLAERAPDDRAHLVQPVGDRIADPRQLGLEQAVAPVRLRRQRFGHHARAGAHVPLQIGRAAPQRHRQDGDHDRQHHHQRQRRHERLRQRHQRRRRRQDGAELQRRHQRPPRRRRQIERPVRRRRQRLQRQLLADAARRPHHADGERQPHRHRQRHHQQRRPSVRDPGRDHHRRAGRSCR